MLNKNLKKIDIVKDLSNKTGFSKNFSKKLIEEILTALIIIIKSGNLYLKNIGAFKIILKKERIGRNPKTKEEFKISARKSISFKQSSKLSENLRDLL